MAESPALRVRFGDFQIDESDARLSLAGRPVELPPKAFELLCALVRRPGQLLTKDALLDAVWGHRHVSESVLKSTVSQLRAALADDAQQPRFIETAPRRGYRFIAAIGAPPAEPHGTSVPPPDPAGSGLIGRDVALGQLQASLAAALTGKRQLLFVAGDAGIGKSSLIDRFVGALPAPRPAHALGQCVEHYGAGEAYMPVLEALNMLSRGEAGEGLVGLMRQVAPTWLVQLPWFLNDQDRRELQREVAGATQDRMLREFGELLDRYTAQRPLLLVLEDLHWSDHATVQLIGFLARRRTAAALLLLGSFRPTEVIVDDHPLAGLRQELRLHRLCRDLDLEAFSEAEVGELVAARLQQRPVPEDFVRALHAHTEGLPLFAVNLLDELIADGALYREEADGWQFPDASAFRLPHGVAGVVEKQITRLPSDLQLLLGAASVAGTEFIHAPLADVLQQSPEALQRQLDGIVARQHWLRCTGVAVLPDGRIGTRYAFRHALYRHVFYQRLGLAQRVLWHREVAAALAAAHGRRAPEIAAELAMHFERGQQPAQALGALLSVAARALHRGAAHEALRAVRQGLQLMAQVAKEAERAGAVGPADVADLPGAAEAAELASVELELRVLEGVALTRMYVISDPQVAAAFERARPLCDLELDSPARARALHGLWWVSYVRGELSQARLLAQRILALAEAGSADPGLQLAGYSTMGLTLTMMGELRPAQQHLQAVIDLHQRLGDARPSGTFLQDPGVEARCYLALVAWWTGEPLSARRLAAEAVALAEQIRHPISQVIALHLAAVVHYLAEEWQRSLALIERLFEVIRFHGLPRNPGAFSWVRGHVRAALGQVDDGLAEMREAEASCVRIGMRVGLTGFQLHFAEACRDAGRIDDALAAANRGLTIAVAGQERMLLSPLHRLKAELLLARGASELARTELLAALEAARRQDAAFHELAAIVSGLDGPAALLHDAPEAPALRQRLRLLVQAYAGETLPLLARAHAVLGP
jgi:DNA-binding winged helix-turn-helix (wHTH) protein/tetratricopeptide (TPR) repeat protein